MRAHRALVAFCAIVMIAGAIVRFVRLDSKIYSNDEATTSLHVAGKTLAQFSREVFDGRTRTAGELLAYQRPDPAQNARDIVTTLAVDDPQHPPLTYLLERRFELVAGSPIAARRALPAFYGVLAILAAVWLGFELWSPLAGSIAGALVAASPFAIVYAQFAREYSLWMALTFAATALLVRAIRTGGVLSWTGFTVASILGLYTDTIYAVVLIAHALTAVVLARHRIRAVALGFGVSLAVIVAAYAPWLVVLRAGLQRGLVTNNTYLAAGLPFKLFVLKWIFNIGTLFYDADYRYPKTAFLIVPGLLALGYAFVACARALPQRRSLIVVFALACVGAFAFVVPDLLHHEQRSTASRYLIALWVAAYAALGAGLAMAVEAGDARRRGLAVAFIVFTALTGFGSFAFASRYPTWWVDGSTAPIGPIARAIANAPDASVVWQATWGPGAGIDEQWDFSPIMLASLVPASTRFTIERRDWPFTLPDAGATTFVLDPSSALLAQLRAAGDRPIRADRPTDTVDAQIASMRSAAGRDRGASETAGGPSLWLVRRTR